MSEICDVCDSEATLVREERDVKVGQRAVCVLDEFYRCGDCGEEIYLPGMMDATLRRASDRIREEDGLLQPEQIRAFRTSLGLSQADFEALLGVGQKTVVRWERGTVFQGQAVDSLIRLLQSVPAALTEQARRQGVRLRPSRQTIGERTVVPGTIVILHGFVGANPFKTGNLNRDVVVRAHAGLGSLAVQMPTSSPAG